jgi:hypothetical protein
VQISVQSLRIPLEGEGAFIVARSLLPAKICCLLGPLVRRLCPMLVATRAHRPRLVVALPMGTCSFVSPPFIRSFVCADDNEEEMMAMGAYEHDDGALLSFLLPVESDFNLYHLVVCALT